MKNRSGDCSSSKAVQHRNRTGIENKLKMEYGKTTAQYKDIERKPC